MKKFLTLIAALSVVPFTANATIISVGGPASSLGGFAAIVSAPSDVGDDAAFNTGQEGFNEQQGITLASALNVDGGSIAAGTTVDSHMIFLNTGPGDIGTLGEHFGVVWTFSGEIIGVMSNRNGSLEVDSSSFLGATGTSYPASPFGARGLEGDAIGRGMKNMGLGCKDDCYYIDGSTLTLTMRVTEPGDWIRVITKVPEPGALALLGLGLLGMGLARRRSRA